MQTIEKDVTANIVEKKSKFIANMYYVNNVEDVENKLKQIRKQYYDARHHCYAYRIQTKEGIIEKASDDGEPSRNSRSTNAKFIAKAKFS